jgi:hypothetical protein
MKQALVLVILLGCAPAAAGQDADDYRGGWRTDSGQAHSWRCSVGRFVFRVGLCGVARETSFHGSRHGAGHAEDCRQ